MVDYQYYWLHFAVEKTDTQGSCREVHQRLNQVSLDSEVIYPSASDLTQLQFYPVGKGESTEGAQQETKRLQEYFRKVNPTAVSGIDGREVRPKL